MKNSLVFVTAVEKFAFHPYLLFGEGVDRIYLDMEEAGLQDPVYQQKSFMLYAELRNKVYEKKVTRHVTTQATTQVDEDETERRLIEFCRTPRTRSEMMQYTGLANRKHFAEHYMEPMLAA